MCVSKVQHVTGRKTGCNRSRPVFFGFSIFRQTSQLATEKIQNLCNRNRWSGLLRLSSVRFRSFFQSSELDLRTLNTEMNERHVLGQRHTTVFQAPFVSLRGDMLSYKDRNFKEEFRRTDKRRLTRSIIINS